MSFDLNTAKTVFALIRGATSITVVSDFLKSRNLTHSAGSWDDLWEKRVLPALELGTLTLDDLIRLLREVEESGRQHVFLYKSKLAAPSELIERGRVSGLLTGRGLVQLLAIPAFLDLPDSPTLVDVRWDTADIDLRLIVKEVEKRVYTRFVGEETSGREIIRRYKREDERAVNVARLDRKGNLEIRIGSRSNSSDYSSDVDRFWDQLNPILLRKDFKEISLASAKMKLWNDRDSLTEKIRFTNSTLKNNLGTTLKAAVGALDKDLFQDTGAVSSFATFIDHSAYCDTSNFWFLPYQGSPSQEIHVLIGGEPNEFAIPANCSEADYENVLRQIIELNS